MQVKRTRCAYTRESIRPRSACANPSRENSVPGPTMWVRHINGGGKGQRGATRGGNGEARRENQREGGGQITRYMGVQVALAAVWKIEVACPRSRALPTLIADGPCSRFCPKALWMQ